MPDNGEVKLTINGREVTSSPGRLLIDVAEESDIFVPRFCYHPGLESVAACRMCLVEIEGSKRPLEPACVTYVADGMVVSTNSAAAVEAQESVLELLLINHPLDCPICDRGGECPLQDQALRFGPGSSRYVDEKRHFPKPIPISKLVMLDRERCVLCWRCVRFSEEIAGEPFIDLLDRGSHTQVNTAEGHPFDSYFSGNTIQICPVGALTATPYRFLSRPWDLQVTQTVCSFCAVGCPITLEQRGGEVLRAQALPNEGVNSFWNCDKGRFGHHYVSHPQRLRAPLLRRDTPDGPKFEEISWEAALEEVMANLQQALSGYGPDSVGFIGGSHATNEDLFAASRFFREVIGTPNLDFRTFDAAFPYERLARDGVVGSTARLDDLDRAKAVLWFGPDPKEALPVLHLRLRRAAAKGAKLLVAHPRRITLSALGIDLRYSLRREAQLIRSLAGRDEECGVDASRIGAAREALSEGLAVVCVGQQFVGYSSNAAIDALRELLDSLSEVRLLVCVPNANSQGAIDMGVFPGLAAGHGAAEPGLSTGGMLTAAAERRLKFLWIMGADPLSDFPDATLADHALESETFLVVSELFPTDTARSANLILPAASFAEKEGSFTNLERRIQKVAPSMAAPGAARSDWSIFADLAARMGHDWGWTSAADVAAMLAQVVPTHGGYSWDAIEPPDLPTPRAGTRPGANAWPLSWELRAVDATRRKGWIWDSPSVGATAGLARASEGEDSSAGDSGALRNLPASESEPAAGERARDVPTEGGFPLVLLVGRALYDNGQMVSRSAELAPVTPSPFVELHPDEAESRGLTDGQEVTVRSNRGSVRVPLRVSGDTPAGAAYMLFDQPGIRANSLIEFGRETNLVEVFP